MVIPFRDQDEVDALGLAGYLKLGRDGDDYSGAIIVINARGEPVHFLCNRVTVTSRTLWREEDIELGAGRRLLQSLLSACPAMPTFVLCQASETSEHLFVDESHGAPLVARIATGERLAVTWYPRPPAPGTPALALWERLSTRGLLYEPFTRAAKGMAEALQRRAQPAPPNPASAGT